MAAGIYNITIEQGATYSQIFTYKDSLDALVNLTGYTARMQVRPRVNSASYILSLTTADSKITLGGVLGTITLSLTATETTALEAGNYVYDLELITGTTVTRLLEGEFIITPEVTR